MTGNLATAEADGPERPLLEATMAASLEARQLARYCWAAPLVKGRRVLDAGCGTGRGAASLADKSPTELVGVDETEAVMEVARSEVPAGVQVLRAGLDHLPFDAGTFDLGLSFGLRRSERNDLVAELLRVVKPDGLVLVAASPDGAQPSRGLLSERRGRVAVAQEYELAGSEVALVRPDGRTGDRPATAASFVGTEVTSGDSRSGVILMASDAPFPSIDPLAVACEVGSTDQWLRYGERQQRLIGDLETRIRELEGHLGQRDELRRTLRATEQALAVRIASYEEAVQTTSLVTDERYRNTISWKVSFPLRRSKPMVKGLVRRVRRSLV